MSKLLTPEQLAKCRKVFRSKRLSVTNPEIANQWIDDLLDHIEALDAQLKTIHISYDKKMHLLVMQVDSADWATAEVVAENKTLLNTIAARDQWANQLTEQYAELIKRIVTNPSTINHD